MTDRSRLALLVALATLFGLCASSSVRAQSVAQSGARAVAVESSACDYRSCALGIAPAWDGLAVVRGTDGSRVANLYFLWPRDISEHFRGSDSSMTHVRRAVRLRRVGAALTDAGALAVVGAAASALSAGRFRHGDAIAGAAGAAAFALSVPLQFAADGELSRAVWWHNLRFAR